MMTVTDINGLFVLDRSAPPTVDLSLPFEEFLYALGEQKAWRGYCKSAAQDIESYKAQHSGLSLDEVTALDRCRQICLDNAYRQESVPRPTEWKGLDGDGFISSLANEKYLHFFYHEALLKWRFDKLQELIDAYPASKFAIAAHYLIHGSFGSYDEEDIYRNKALLKGPWDLEPFLWACKDIYWRKFRIVEDYEITYNMPTVQGDEELLNYMRYKICEGAYSRDYYLAGKKPDYDRMTRHGEDLLNSTLDDFSIKSPENLALSTARKSRAELQIRVCFLFNRMYRDLGQSEKALTYLERVLTGHNGYIESRAEKYFALALLKMSGQHPDQAVRLACKDKLFAEYGHTYHKIKLLIGKAKEERKGGNFPAAKGHLDEAGQLIRSGKYYLTSAQLGQIEQMKKAWLEEDKGDKL